MNFAHDLAAVEIVTNPPGSTSPSKKSWGFIDGTGSFVIAPQFEEADNFFEERAAVRDGKKWGFIDRMGSRVIAAKFDKVGHFSNGLAPVGIKNAAGTITYGYINPAGAYILEPPTRVLTALNFSENIGSMTVAKAWYERMNPLF